MATRNRTGQQTTAIHAGEGPDPTTGASAPPIHMSSTYVVDEPAGFSAHDLGPDSPYAYSRWANPTVDMLERKIAAWAQNRLGPNRVGLTFGFLPNSIHVFGFGQPLADGIKFMAKEDYNPGSVDRALFIAARIAY